MACAYRDRSQEHPWTSANVNLVRLLSQLGDWSFSQQKPSFDWFINWYVIQITMADDNTVKQSNVTHSRETPVSPPQDSSKTNGFYFFAHRFLGTLLETRLLFDYLFPLSIKMQTTNKSANEGNKSNWINAFSSWSISDKQLFSQVSSLQSATLS